MIETPRLNVIPATLAHARAEVHDRPGFAHLLQAEVPDNWPPESTVDALPLFLEWLQAAPQHAGWYGWYALARDLGTHKPVLVGGGGFLGPPQDGQVGLGYSVLPQFQRKGYASELAGALVDWARGHAEVNRIVAETEWANPASVRVLAKLGFAESGPGSESGGTLFVLSDPA